MKNRLTFLTIFLLILILTFALCVGNLFADEVTITHQGTISGAGAPNYLDLPLGLHVIGDYAYIASLNDDALTIIDVSNPSNPTFAGSIQGTGAPNYLGDASGVYVIGSYAYVASSGDNALTIIDISNPSNPTFEGSIQGSGAPNYLGGATDVYVNGNYAYVACGSDDALTIINVSNPSNPTFAGSVQTDGSPNFNLVDAHEVHVSGNYAFVASRSNDADALTVVDVHNPTNPTIAGFTTDGLNRPPGVYLIGSYAYVTNSISLAVIDISNPPNPTLAGSIYGFGAPNYLNGANGVYISGNYAYVASINDGALTIIDISNPSNPTFAGSIQGAGAPNYLKGAYNVFVSGGYVYVVGALDNSLSIFTVQEVIGDNSEGMEGTGPIWVRTMPMTCWQVFINEDNMFEFIFWYPYKDNNWVQIFDMEGNMVYEVDVPLDDPHIIVDLPDGMYNVKTFRFDPEDPIQEFIIGKP